MPICIAIAALGVPDVLMRTCRKITTAAGSLYRDGGFYVENADGSTQLCILKQVGYFCNFSFLTSLV